MVKPTTRLLVTSFLFSLLTVVRAEQACADLIPTDEAYPVKILPGYPLGGDPIAESNLTYAGTQYPTLPPADYQLTLTPSQITQCGDALVTGAPFPYEFCLQTLQEILSSQPSGYPYSDFKLP